MKTQMRNYTHTMTLAAALLCGMVSVALAARANQGENHGIIPPQGRAFGQSYSQWAAQWWQWAYAIPSAVNPLNDPTGQYAATDQSGPVWFLAGTTAGDAERTVIVPSGKGLFFPIVNLSWVNLPSLGDNPWSAAQDAFARTIVADVMATAYDLSCEIDGKPVANLSAYLCATAPGTTFMVEMPADDIYGYPLAAGVYGPCVDSGFYLLLAPLSVGEHTIHFTGGLSSISMHLEVTYHLTVR